MRLADEEGGGMARNEYVHNTCESVCGGRYRTNTDLNGSVECVSPIHLPVLERDSFVAISEDEEALVVVPSCLAPASQVVSVLYWGVRVEISRWWAEIYKGGRESRVS